MLARPFLIQKNTMACDLSLGRIKACKDSVGGINNIYLINYDDLVIGDVTYDVTDTDIITDGYLNINKITNKAIDEIRDKKFLLIRKVDGHTEIDVEHLLI